MSISYNKKIGPYAECTAPRCVEIDTRDLSESINERLHTPHPMDGEPVDKASPNIHFWLPNVRFPQSWDLNDTDQDCTEIYPRRVTEAVKAFEDAFEPELGELRRAYSVVQVKYGVICWAD